MERKTLTADHPFSFLVLKTKDQFYAINASLILELIDVRLMRISEAKLCRSFPEKFANIKFGGGRGRKENNPTLKNWTYSVEHILANILAIDIHSNHKNCVFHKTLISCHNNTKYFKTIQTYIGFDWLPWSYDSSEEAILLLLLIQHCNALKHLMFDFTILNKCSSFTF